MTNSGYKIRNQQAAHFITFSVVKWVDVLIQDKYKEIIIESLKFCQKEKGLIIHAWVIMQNHVHFIFSAKEGYRLSNILRDLKKFTSSEITQSIERSVINNKSESPLLIFKLAGRQNNRNSNYQFWQQDNHPVELTSNKMTDDILDYIHFNPVKAGIVEKPEDYSYSSAIDYYTDGSGLLKIENLL